jgi:hypothetical protein
MRETSEKVRILANLKHFLSAKGLDACEEQVRMEEFEQFYSSINKKTTLT